jgi:hypothetical protein
VSPDEPLPPLPRDCALCGNCRLLGLVPGPLAMRAARVAGSTSIASAVTSRRLTPIEQSGERSSSRAAMMRAPLAT